MQVLFIFLIVAFGVSLLFFIISCVEGNRKIMGMVFIPLVVSLLFAIALSYSEVNYLVNADKSIERYGAITEISEDYVKVSGEMYNINNRITEEVDGGIRNVTVGDIVQVTYMKGYTLKRYLIKTEEIVMPSK